MHWRTRCGYLAGFCYYLNTALFTFVAPVISLILLLAMPRQVQLANYGLIMPSIVYNAVVFPAWHRCDFGPEAFMAKMLYGWAHLFAIWDICWRKQLGWQTTGSGNRKAGTRRIWIGIATWNGSTSLAWVMLSGWRMLYFGATFLPLVMMGVVTSALTAMTLCSRRNSSQLIGGAGKLRKLPSWLANR